MPQLQISPPCSVADMQHNASHSRSDDEASFSARHSAAILTNSSRPSHAKRRSSPTRPEMVRAAATSGILLLTTLLFTKGASTMPLPLPLGMRTGLGAWLPSPLPPHQLSHRPNDLPLPPLHPGCFAGLEQYPFGSGEDGEEIPPLRRGQCWQEYAELHAAEQQAITRWWAIFRHPVEWWRSRRAAPLPQDLEVARQLEADDGGAAGQKMAQRTEAADGAPWSQFNDSAMAQVFTPDIAWMMWEEEQRARDGNRTHGMLDQELARSLAHINSIAYCETPNVEAWNCTRCNEAAAGFQLKELINDVGWDLRAFVGYAPVLGAKVVAFRGTDSHSWYNWAENMKAWRVDMKLPYPGAEGSLVHSGFFYSYNMSSLRPNISAAALELEHQYPGQPWYVIGHSMGAAMATLCALDLRFTLMPPPDVRVYTFGSPRVGNDVFATFFKTQIKESWRFTHNRDIVPSVPIQLMGFHHVSREVWIVTFDGGPTILDMCDSSGEDPTCHNSVCYLGLCTSIADHMTYLGGHMYHRNPVGC